MATVAFRGADGQPIVGLPVAIRSERDVQGGTTDEQGRLQRTIEVNASEASVHVLTNTYWWTKELSGPADGVEAVARMKTVRSFQSKHAIPSRLVVALTADQREAMLDYRASNAISASLKVVDFVGQPVDALLISEFGTMSSPFGPEVTKGLVSLSGIAAASPIRFLAGNDGIYKVVTAPASDSDVDLGTLALDFAKDATLHLDVEFTEQSPDWKRDGFHEITVVSASGDYFLSTRWVAAANPEESPILVGTPCPGIDPYRPNHICAPSGEYWVLYGPDVHRPMIFDLLDRIRAGQSLGDAAIKVTAIAGQTVDVKVRTATLIDGLKALGID